VTWSQKQLFVYILLPTVCILSRIYEFFLLLPKRSCYSMPNTVPCENTTFLIKSKNVCEHSRYCAWLFSVKKIKKCMVDILNKLYRPDKCEDEKAGQHAEHWVHV
jgi:hypothetical protein